MKGSKKDKRSSIPTDKNCALSACVAGSGSKTIGKSFAAGVQDAYW